MLRFAEEILLLLLDDGGGTFAELPAQSLELALAGAVLMDLALEDRIDTDPQRLFVVNPQPVDDELLTRTLQCIADSPATCDTRHWIREIASSAGEIRARSLARLVECGVLRQEQGRLLWVFRTRRYPVIDDEVLKEVRLRIMEVLQSDDIPDPRDTLIIALADACGIFASLLSGEELQSLLPRIRQIGKLDLIGREVTAAVREIESDLASAMVSFD